MTDRKLAAKQTRPRVDLEQATNELAACVERYRTQNDRFERALAERHARWADQGLFRHPRPARDRFEQWLNERDEAARERQRSRLGRLGGAR